MIGVLGLVVTNLLTYNLTKRQTKSTSQREDEVRTADITRQDTLAAEQRSREARKEINAKLQPLYKELRESADVYWTALDLHMRYGKLGEDGEYAYPLEATRRFNTVVDELSLIAPDAIVSEARSLNISIIRLAVAKAEVIGEAVGWTAYRVDYIAALDRLAARMRDQLAEDPPAH